MADSSRNGRPAALFIAPIMPSDRGNGLAMRTAFLLDSYAKRFAIDLAVVPVAGGAAKLTPFVEARVRRAVVLPAVAPDTHFTAKFPVSPCCRICNIPPSPSAHPRRAPSRDDRGILRDVT